MVLSPIQYGLAHITSRTGRQGLYEVIAYIYDE